MNVELPEPFSITKLNFDMPNKKNQNRTRTCSEFEPNPIQNTVEDDVVIGYNLWLLSVVGIFSSAFIFLCSFLPMSSDKSIQLWKIIKKARRETFSWTTFEHQNFLLFIVAFIDAGKEVQKELWPYVFWEGNPTLKISWGNNIALVERSG